MSSKGPTSSSLTIRPVQFLVIISFYIMQCAAMKDVGNITLLNQPGVVGIWRWNDTVKYYPRSDFRNDSARNYYDVWPEDLHNFKFPCEDRKSRLTLSNFTYSMNEGLIRSLQYYDLGIVYRYRSYWRRPTTCISCIEMPVGFPAIYCEHADLIGLYHFRARRTVLQGVEVGVAIVAILQITCAIIGILIPVSLLNRKEGLHAMAGIVAGLLRRLNWDQTILEWLHFLPLAIAGYSLMEGCGHSDPHHWRILALYTLAYYYFVQIVCAFISSFLRQCANSMKLILQSGQILAKSSRESHPKMLVGQVVVCLVMQEYLCITDQIYLDFMIQVVFAVVAVAATVSMTIAISVACKALLYIVKVSYARRSPGVLIHLWHKMKKRIAAMMADNPAAGTSCQPQPGSSTKSPVLP